MHVSWIASEDYIEAVYGRSCYYSVTCLQNGRRRPVSLAQASETTKPTMCSELETVLPNRQATVTLLLLARPQRTLSRARIVRNSRTRRLSAICLAGYLPRLHRSSSRLVNSSCSAAAWRLTRGNVLLLCQINLLRPSSISSNTKVRKNWRSLKTGMRTGLSS